MEDEDRSYVIDDQYQDNRSTLNEPTERERSNDNTAQVYMVLNAAQVKNGEYEIFKLATLIWKKMTIIIANRLKILSNQKHGLQSSYS